MDGFLALRRKFFEAVFFGLVITGACHLPPLDLAARLDRALYDTWLRLQNAFPESDFLLVLLDEPADLLELGAIAQRAGATLLITTLPEPPSDKAVKLALAPLELPIGDARLRSTDWLDGGHLWFRPDVDGVIRHDWPTIGTDDAIPSLAFHAAQRLAPLGANGLPADVAPGTDAAGRRWLRFYPAAAFERTTLAALLAQPERVHGRVVLAGRTTSSLRTPLGELTAIELLAQALAGYRRGEWVEAGRFGPIAVWTATLTLLVIVALKPLPNRAAWLAFGGAASGGLLLWSAAAFTYVHLWLPIAAAVTLLLATMGFMAVRATRLQPAEAPPEELQSARRLAAGGALEEAWLAYRQIPPSTALLAELYDLASALDAAGHKTHAADLFHRVAQIDGQFRDVARRLVQSARPQIRPVEDAERAQMPATLGRYQLLEPIGRGAMGHVYLGRDPKINRIVAIKAVDLAAEFEPSEIENASRQFLREAETAGRLSHPNIVTIYDVGEADGLAYIAMEYLRGRHLSDFGQPDTLLATTTVLELLARTADALDYAHAQNVVHRDIKPANIMYDAVSDGLKITDFGIARLIDVSRTRTGIVLGTPAFMSPEQLEGKNVNGHTDLFALGVSLYQLLTGQLPFRGASMTKLMFVIANEPHQPVTAVRPELPVWLDPIVDRALAKNPAHRFQSGAEMAAALRDGVARLN